jgi:hypothetical protein
MAIHFLTQELSAVKDFWSLEKTGEDKDICSVGGIITMFFVEPFAILGLLLQKAPTSTSCLWEKDRKGRKEQSRIP